MRQSLALAAVAAQDGDAPSGTWAVVASEQDGKPFAFPAKGTLFTFADGKVTVGPKMKEGKVLYTFKADSKKSPKEIDLVSKDDKRTVTLRGIYRLEKGRLVICIGTVSGSGDEKALEGARPTEFKSGPNIQMLTFEAPKK